MSFDSQSSKFDFQNYESFQFFGFWVLFVNQTESILVLARRKSLKFKHNKRFKRDSQRVAFLLCVGFCGYGVMRKLGNGVGCPL
ncbi:hypothetical protein ACVD4U_004396, partial [Vibrio vulnificus]